MERVLLSAAGAGLILITAGIFVKPRLLKFLFLFVGIFSLIAAGGYGAYELFLRKMIFPQKQEPAPQIASIPTPSRRDKLTIEQLKEDLRLSDYQVKRLRPIMKEESLRRSTLVRKYSGGGPEARQALEKELKLFQRYYEDMYSHIMSEEQFKKYLEIRESHSSGD
jgi:hypothetical protein